MTSESVYKRGRHLKRYRLIDPATIQPPATSGLAVYSTQPDWDDIYDSLEDRDEAFLREQARGVGDVGTFGDLVRWRFCSAECLLAGKENCECVCEGYYHGQLHTVPLGEG